MTSVGSIQGRVLLPSGHPVSERIKITLSTLNDPGMTLYTDTNGSFSFDNLRTGTYTVEIAGDPKSYEPVSEQVRLMRGMRVNLTMHLKAKPETATINTGGVVSVGEADQEVPAPAKKEFEKGVDQATEGKAQEAIQSFKRALEIFPTYLMARNDLGVQYLKLRQFDNAVEQFESAIEINAKAFNPRLNLGIAMVEKKRFTEAMDQLLQAVALNSSSPAVHLYIGIVSVETDDLETAAKELTKAQVLGGPEYVVVHFYRGCLHMKKGERDEAAYELKSYLAKSPSGSLAQKAKSLLEELNQ
jgi:Flp pilus assembly protein TadD